MSSVEDLLSLYNTLPKEKQLEMEQNTEAILRGLRWIPNEGPQTAAYLSLADEVLYGGAAGGGKSDLLLGTAFNEHGRSAIFRAAFRDIRGLEQRAIDIVGNDIGYNHGEKMWQLAGKVIEFGALEKVGSEKGWQGRPHDLIAYDEAAQIAKAKIVFINGWLRSEHGGQRKRILYGSNPPLRGEGDWLIVWFAPWLDPLFSSPAKPGELRWFVNDKDGDPVWVSGPGRYDRGDGQMSDAMSRTFIPALLVDNPYLRDTGYRRQVENLPEPMRSALLLGDFLAAREDHAWQIIPAAWIAAAQRRWREDGRKDRMLSMGVDMAQGGKARLAVARLHSPAWFDKVLTTPGKDVTDAPTTAGHILPHQRNAAIIGIDMTGGWGGGIAEFLRTSEVDAQGVVFSHSSGGIAKDSGLPFFNLRSELYWRFREALDPNNVDPVSLPPGKGLAAELAAARWRMRGKFILVEEKDDIIERLNGASPDEAEAVLIAWHLRAAGLAKQLMGGKQGRLPKHWGEQQGGDNPYDELG